MVLAFIRDNCEVGSGLPLLDLEADTRDVLRRFVGEGSAEAIAIAKSRGALLWTDDLAVTAIGQNQELRVHSVWTQAVLYHARQTKRISAERYTQRLGTMLTAGFRFLRITWWDLYEMIKVQEGNFKSSFGRALAALIVSVGLSNRNNRIITGVALLILWKRDPSGMVAKRTIGSLLDVLAERGEAQRFASAIYRELPIKRFGKQHVRPLKQFLRSWRSKDGEFKPSARGRRRRRRAR